MTQGRDDHEEEWFASGKVVVGMGMMGMTNPVGVRFAYYLDLDQYPTSSDK